MFTAYIDDSVGKDGTYVLAGHIATDEQWAELSNEWRSLLPYASLNKSGKYNFHMVEMAKSPERMERVIAFRRIIEKYVIFSIAVKINVNDLYAAINRVFVQGVIIKFNQQQHPFAFCLVGLIQTFNENRSLFDPPLPADEPVHFFFDETSHKNMILSMWDRYTSGVPADRRYLYANTPGFGDDEINLPLQAADLWAWWVRKRYQQGERLRLQTGDIFDHVVENMPRIFIEYEQDKILQGLIATVKLGLGPGIRVCDLRPTSKGGYVVSYTMPPPLRINNQYSLQLHSLHYKQCWPYA